MGWVVWIVLTLACIAAAYAVAVAAWPDGSTPNRAITVLLVAPAAALIDIELCGFFDVLRAAPLAVVGLLLFVAMGFLAVRRATPARLRSALQLDLHAPRRVLVDVWREREPAIGTVVPAAIALVIACIIVWYYKSWTWDPVWYHVPMTSYAIQNGSLRWIDTGNHELAGYPRNVEWLAIWNCVFARDNRFDDSSQLPFALLGMLVVSAWARREGASRPLATAVGAAWFALPPIFLQAYTTHVDVACGALLTTAAYFATGPNGARERWLAWLATGLYVGTKFTGLFHFMFLGPWLVARMAFELYRATGMRWRRALDQLGSVVLFAAVGLYKYVQNFLHTGNPVFPFRTTVPVLGRVLPGPMEVSDLWNAPRGSHAWFFGAPNDLQHMLTNWFDTHPFFAPDVRSGGFGPAFRWILLPAIVAIAGDAIRLRQWKRTVPLVVLFALSIGVPAAWWPRFTIAAASASLVAFAMVHKELPSRWLRAALSIAFVAAVGVGYKDAYAGYIAYPKYFDWARRSTWVERSALQLDAFHWPTQWGLTRERELREGDVVTYDEAAVFLAEFFCHDYRTRVTFVSSAGDPNAYLARLRAMHARWVGVRPRTLAEWAVRRAGADFLFVAPLSDEAVYRMPTR